MHRFFCKKKITFLTLFFFTILSCPSAEEVDNTPAVDFLNNLIPSYLNEIGEGAPEWLERTDFSIKFEETFKPLWTIETIQPFYQTPDTLRHTIFFQGRYAHDSATDTVNAGLGYRYLHPSEYWLLGVNSFYDHEFEHRHERASIGGEILGQFASVHGNFYNALSGRRFFTEPGNISVTERALDGWDVEGQMQVPFMPWMYLGVKAFEWNGKTRSDLDGLQYSLNLNITKNIEVDMGYIDDNESENKFIKIGFNYGGPKRIEHTMVKNFIMPKFFTNRNLKNQTLQKVRRNHNIVVETTRGGGAGIIIGRGT